ncbi:MAG: hypothetical protein A3K09_06265 [Nitrospinae bacterium RIFCSPLOWO2_12_FULL_47_7]|nr:MAG: hypothetical protein A3K09_06265 [Nitrospinae bacterium RIFCSPLOWO2_12_FULL_47_7]
MSKIKSGFCRELNSDIITVMTFWRLGIILVVLVTMAGCSTRQLAARMAFPLVQGQYLALNEESDTVLARQAIPANLKMLEGMLKSDESNIPVLHNLAEGFCGFAFGFVEDEDPIRAASLYLRGRNYALRSLPAQPNGKDLVALDLEGYKSALRQMDSTHLPGLFWLSQCWAGWFMLNLDNPSALVDIPRIEILLLRTLELGDTFHYAGPHLLLGSFYGGRTKILGGNPVKSLAHFESNLKLTNSKYLLTQLLFARTYAIQTQDRKLFERLLNEALASPAEALPEQRLVNEIAKTKAKKLLESADDLF